MWPRVGPEVNMRKRSAHLILMYLLAAVICPSGWAGGQPANQAAREERPDPQQLVRDTIYNEMHDHEQHGYWQYRVQKKAKNESELLERVETSEGPVQRLIAVNGEPLNSKRRQEEEDRLRVLLSDPGRQKQARQEYAEDEKRIGRTLQLLSTAFVYQYENADGENYCLSFLPNPDFHPSTIEARVFHAMQGKIYINKRWKRLARLEGHVMENIDFGYGLLGRLYQGGWFDMERVQVNQTDWKTRLLEVHVEGRAILFKTIAKNTHEERFGFQEVPEGITLSQAKHLLDEEYTVSRNDPKKLQMKK
jgi:hypothetical protein